MGFNRAGDAGPNGFTIHKDGANSAATFSAANFRAR